MLIGLICMILLFVLGQYGVARSGGSRQLGIAVGALAALAFAGGFAERAAFYPTSDAMPMPTAPAAVAPPAPIATPQRLTAAQIQALTPISSSKLVGHIDNTSADVAASRPLTFAHPQMIYIDGWAGDPTTHAPGPALIAILDHRIRFDISPFYHMARPDVAKAFNLESMQSSGIVHAPLAVAGLTPGTHTIEVGVVGTDQRTLFLVQPAVTITIVK
jgi:hypothetical protein